MSDNNVVNDLASRIIGAIIVTSLYYIYWKTKESRRVQSIQYVAKSLKLNFSTNDSSNIQRRYSEHKLFQIGTSFSHRFAYNVITGAYKKHTLYSFDYLCEGHGGENTDRDYYSCVLLDIKMPLKHLFICPHWLLEKIVDSSMPDVIDFESTEFNRKFYVRGENKKFAYDIIHPRMMEFLLHGCNYSIDFSGQSILLFKEGVRKPKEVEPMIKLLTDFVELIPEYVIEELKAGHK